MSDVIGPLPLGSLIKPERRGSKTPKPLPKPTKRIKQIGRRGQEYNQWRDNVAIPYLDATYGHKCSVCGIGGKLDVAHIKGRGSHQELKMELTNIKWLCRDDHIKEDSGMRY